MESSDNPMPWKEGSDEHRGKRLLPHIIDYYAHEEPNRVFAAIPRSDDIADGFVDIDMRKMAAAVNQVAWWIDENFLLTFNKSPEKRVLAFIGPSDLRFSILLIAAIKCGSKVMFISPRNTSAQNSALLQQAKVDVLLYADSMSSMAVQLQGLYSSLSILRMPSLAQCLGSQPKHYSFSKSFAELENEHCLILHSSGSTGIPKLVYMTHGTFACTDNDSFMPVPEGRRAQNAAQFNFSPAGRYYSCFPSYHLAGVQAYILLPSFAKTATVVMGPATQPPSGYLLNSIVEQQVLRAIYAPPSIIEQWALEPNAMKKAEDWDFVLYGGGPLAPAIGHRLKHVTDVCQMYGSLEIGQVQMLVSQEDWDYLEPNPYEECDMQEVEEGLYEMVFHQEERFRSRRSLSHNFPDVKTWRTRDLFTPHPTKSGLWRFHSRVDDMIVLSTSHKFWPIPVEQILHGHPLVAGAVLVGNGRPEPVLIIEPRTELERKKMGITALFEAIWPVIMEANLEAPTYGRVRRSHVIFTEPHLGLCRTPKGTVARKPTEMLYSRHIEAVFENGGIFQMRKTGSFDSYLLNAAKNFVRALMQELLPDVELYDSDNIFQTGGLDSLMAVELAQRIRADMAHFGANQDDSVNFWLRLIITHPSIELLAQSLLRVAQTHSSEREHKLLVDQTQQVHHILQELQADFPNKQTQRPDVARQPGGPAIILLGARGRLGPYIVRDLLTDPQIMSIKCLNRGNDGQQAFQRRAKELGLDLDVFDPRLQFLTVDISQPDFGLSPTQLNEILDTATTIIHNLWTVNFALPLVSFKPAILKSVLTVIDLAHRAASRPRIVFVSSIGSAQQWDSATTGSSIATVVPESPMQGLHDAMHMTGYTQSKYIAESLLQAAAKRLDLDISILRLGQVAGPRSMEAGAVWKSHDWVHSLVVLCRASRMVPNDLGPVDWIPVDQMSRAIIDIALRKTVTLTGRESPDVFNLVHPSPIPFTQFADAIQACIGQGPKSQQVSFQQWVDGLIKLPPGTLSVREEIEMARIQPFFSSLIGKRLPTVKTSKAQAASPTLASMEQIDSELMVKWCQHWV
ncbi:hypothetical protein ASPACDRAFT_1898720 [Aspergillus aculeatus ATCC 16872]|uniref:Carrier domain-containing protein n=1 Tax=Aspergillus aculeatus (strain ATCC 16872 / CBS 172.66 / WB 5094) TaxID=690307 RepID=A0A1L9WZD7_ASPA1|nr:uncharacterized protein ASPACDRAFT_1898720 [Aspergillus aculeatus ATCC 16872]OJK01627.1 hypothetical protein ASPACDRAFT_1898720 [Aspergillus aculeatus ATCC 16872]